MATREDAYDVIVVGAGVFGLSTALFMAAHYPKLKVLIIEQYRIGHSHGSSHSQIRTIRGIYPDKFYLELCELGQKAYWPELEQLLGEKLTAPNRCVSMFEVEEEYQQYEGVAKVSHGRLETMPLQNVYKFFPDAPTPGEHYRAVVDHGAAVGFAERFIKSAAEYLRKSTSVTLIEESQVTAISNSSEGVKVQVKTEGGVLELRAKKAQLSCGRWISKLLPETSGILKEVVQTVAYWEMKRPEDFEVSRFPNWSIFGADGLLFYGLPDVNKDGLKMALHSDNPNFYASFKSDEAYLAHMKALYMERMERYFKGKVKKLQRLERCYYTSTKTEEMLLDWSDEHDNVLVVSPCSGQGYKFASILGKIAADLLVSDRSIPLFEQNRHLFRLFYHLGVHL